ncbi:MAG: adenylate/guanylate cyclase domain-containing protein [Alphaproteobacteria bacterium]|nr:adenylate/guanylate cyclase domain-containing protein [Alphaproteobacteria bacterium]
MDEPTLVRRLTTIISIDVVGFSTMSARDEEHALELLRARMATAEAMIKHHRGRVFKFTGDGALAEFASPVEAVRAAVEVQEAMRSANATAGPDDQLQLRIGINLGDVVESGEDLMGDAVNVAVRLESIAPVGGVCVSAAIYEQIVGKLTLGAEDMGEQHVKNIPRPIHAYRLTPQAAVVAAPPPAGTAAKKRAPALGMVIGLAVALAVFVAGGAWWLEQQSSRAPAQEAQTPAAPTRAAEPPKAAEAQPPAPPPAQPPSQPERQGAPATEPAEANANAASVEHMALPAAPAPPPPPPDAAPTPRPYSPGGVPFVPEFRRRLLENYAEAEGAKSMAINARGIVAITTRRIDDALAQRIALEECNRVAQREIPSRRAYDNCMTYAVGNDVVWTYRMPPIPPAPYLPPKRPQPPITLDPATVPLIGDLARQNLAQRYMKAERPRALVLGRDHSDWVLFGQTSEDAVRRTLQLCGHVTGRVCAAYAVENQVVVRAPQRFRIMDVFIPSDVPNLDSAQRATIEKYLVADDWRAVAAGRNGRIGIVSGQASESAAADEAVRACTSAGGTDCTILAIGPFLVTK